MSEEEKSTILGHCHRDDCIDMAKDLSCDECKEEILRKHDQELIDRIFKKLDTFFQLDEETDDDAVLSIWRSELELIKERIEKGE